MSPVPCTRHLSRGRSCSSLSTVNRPGSRWHWVFGTAKPSVLHAPEPAHWGPRPSVMSHVICRKERVRFLASPRWQGGWHETVSGGAGSWGARGAGGDHAQGLTSFAEGAQRAGSAQLRRGRVQRAARDRPGDRRGVADQRAQGGPGQEAVCGGRSGSGAWGPAGSSSEIPSQGGRGIRGAPRRAQLRRSARGALAVVAAPAGGPRGGTRLHRHRLARDGAARAKKKMPSNRGGASAG